MLKIMPAKNVIKDYQENAYYHVYNRGVDKGLIFQNDNDYKTFLSYLKFYLTPQGESLKGAPSRQLKNYVDEIELLCYCLMPNHFHLLIKQHSLHGMDHFLRSISTKYARYFNTHYKRVGHLFQGSYKAVRIENEYQFIYISKYIHRNTLSLSPYKDNPRRLQEYPYSSYGNYLRRFQQTWVRPNEILTYFSQKFSELSYEAFVEQGYAEDIDPIKHQVIDLE